jgi:hypothetical protein
MAPKRPLWQLAGTVAIGTFRHLLIAPGLQSGQSRLRSPEIGGCAIGIANVDLFAKMTGIDFHVEGPLGQFALGRGAESPLPSPGAGAGQNET